MAEPEQGDREQGTHYLDLAWFAAVDALSDIIILDDRYTAEQRIAASKVVLDYSAQFAVGLNPPYIPTDRPPELDDDDDEEEESND